METCGRFEDENEGMCSSQDDFHPNLVFLTSFFKDYFIGGALRLKAATFVDIPNKHNLR